MKLRVSKPGLGEQAPGVVLAERESDAGARVCEGHRQAVHDADAVLNGCHGIAHIVLEAVGRVRLAKQEDTVGCQISADALEYPGWVDLVMEGVEHEDGVERLADVQVPDVGKLEGEISQALICCLLARAPQCVLVGVVAGEHRLRESLGKDHERVT